MDYKRAKNSRAIIAGTVFFLCFCFTAGMAQPKSGLAKNANVEKLLAESGDALKAGDLIRSKELAQKALLLAPRNDTANTLAGIIAEKENKLPEAEKYFAIAAKTAPRSPEARNNYGAILVRLGRSSEASREFTASLAANPGQTSALVNLAQIRTAEGNLKAAHELFGKAEAIDPDTEILRAMISISLKLNEKEQAAREYSTYSALIRRSTLPPAAGTNDISLAEALLVGGLPDECRQELEYILSIEPQNIDALVLSSRAFLRQKNIASAGRLLESAIAGGLDDAKIYLALAEVYEAGGYPENAIPAMRLAIRKDPRNDFYRSRYGLLLVNSKAPAAAVIRIEEALKEFPRSASLWFALGIAQFDDNKITEAQKAFEMALSIDPKLIQALAYLGAVFVEQARYADAVKTYERAIELNKTTAILYYLLADTLLKMTEIDNKRAETDLKRAVELDASLASAHITLGRLYLRQQRWREAAESLEIAAKLEPSRAETFYQLGQVYGRLKRKEESKSALEKFKQLNDSQKQQKEVSRRDLVRRLADVRF